MKGTLCISWGPWGGFYFHKGYSTRVCLGFVAFTLFPDEIDDILKWMRENNV
jgi:hypothetical protein